MLAHRRWLTLGLLLPALWLAACGDSPTHPASAPLGKAVTPGSVGHTLRPMKGELLPPDETQAVLELENGISPEDFAIQHGLVLIESHGKMGLFEGIPDPVTADSMPGVLQSSTNRAVDITEGLDLVFGFYEGEFDFDEIGDQKALETLELEAAHALSIGEGVTVAILDTGADLEHEHLLPNLIPLPEGSVLPSAETANGIDDNGNDVVDEAFGHGTHVAGIVRTVAPGAMILPIRVLNDDGVGSLWDLITGLVLAREHGAQVVNLSLSLSEPVRLFENVLLEMKQERITVVAAAGNSGWEDPRYPATSQLAIGVAAVDAEGRLADFSGAGDRIEIAAPGVAILSSYPGGLQVAGTGTSMATPMVAGTFALARGLRVRTPEDAWEAIAATSRALSPPEYAPLHGRVVAGSALRHIPGNKPWLWHN